MLCVTHPVIVDVQYIVAAANYYLHYVLDCQTDMVGKGPCIIKCNYTMNANIFSVYIENEVAVPLFPLKGIDERKSIASLTLST